MKLPLLFLASVLSLAPVSAVSTTEDNGFPRGYYSGDPLPPSTIYLTFDDGPAPDTATILDILKEKGVRATFFINAFNRKAPPETIGKENNLLNYRDVLKRMVDEGHVIGNHSFSHRDLGSLTASQIEWQLGMVQKDLDAALGDAAPVLKLVRPPFGSPWLGNWSSLEVRRKTAAVVARYGLIMNWTQAWDSSDSVDFVPGEIRHMVSLETPPDAPYREKEQRELKRLLRHADGMTSGIVLFHDTHPTSRDILAEVIDAYKARGYHFETLDEYAKWRWGPKALDAYTRN